MPGPEANILPARYQPGASPVERTPRGEVGWGGEFAMIFGGVSIDIWKSI
jgi:hypothetical protein